MSFRRTGVLSVEELARLGIIPPEERMKKKPVAMIECPEEVPCNICVSACPFNAIRKETLYSRPRLEENKCIGCGVCVVKCPGLAIFVVDLRGEDALLTLPYEMSPPPAKGDKCLLLDREGRVVGEGEVVKAWSYDSTWAVTVRVPRDMWLHVRAVKVVKNRA
ncbi:MAG: 4Fe-4S binding protein [Thermogladius sp.]